MIKITKIIVLSIIILLLSGCTGQQKSTDQGSNQSGQPGQSNESKESVSTQGDQSTVKNGDNISVDYTGSIKNGEVFDTTMENIAKENNISTPGRDYKPLKFTVGKGQVIEGFDEGVIGMKVGDSKTIEIPPEKGYGLVNPQMIRVIPVIQDIPATRTLPKVFEVPVASFENKFGIIDYTVGNIVNYPDTNLNLIITNITSNNISLAYNNLTVGYEISQIGIPWNQTVVNIDDKNFTVKANAKKNDVVHFQGAPWNSTVQDINDTDIIVKHIAIPDTETRSTYGQIIRIHFNETSITMDQNNKLADKTLVFNVTLK